MAQTTGTTTITRKPKDGKQGTTFSIRKWEEVGVGDSFFVENVESGVLISDIVIYKDTQTGVTSKWLCKKDFVITETTEDDTHVSLADANPTKSGTAYWKPFSNYHNVATDLVLADKAIIDNLLLNNMKAYPKDENGKWDTENPTVEIDGNSGEIKLKGELTVRVFRNTVGEVVKHENVNLIDIASGGNLFFTTWASNRMPDAKDFEGVEVTIVGQSSVSIMPYSNHDDVPFASTTYFREHYLFLYAFRSVGNSIVKMMSVRISQTEGDPYSDWKWMITSVCGSVIVDYQRMYNGQYIKWGTPGTTTYLENAGACRHGDYGERLQIDITPQ